MLDTIPQDQTFTQLIITQMVTYYDKCFGLYKGNSSRVSTSQVFADTNQRWSLGPKARPRAVSGSRPQQH